MTMKKLEEFYIQFKKNYLLENLGFVKIDNANRFALEPEFTITEYLEPIYLAKLFSNFFTFFPIVTQVESNESNASLTSAKP